MRGVWQCADDFLSLFHHWDDATPVSVALQLGSAHLTWRCKRAGAAGDMSRQVWDGSRMLLSFQQDMARTTVSHSLMLTSAWFPCAQWQYTGVLGTWTAVDELQIAPSWRWLAVRQAMCTAAVLALLTSGRCRPLASPACHIPVARSSCCLIRA